VAVRHGYIVIGNYARSTKSGLIHISSTVHSQYRCSGIQKDSHVVVAAVTKHEDKDLATYRGASGQVRWCERCPDELKWDWHSEAACYATYPAVDMVDMGTGQHHRAAGLIEEYCNKCPVMLECAEFALSRADETVGVWGGVHVPQHRGHNEGIAALEAQYATLRGLGDVA
jgi:hypothetical protein